MTLQPISKEIIMACMCNGCKLLFPVVGAIKNLQKASSGFEPVLLEGSRRHNEDFIVKYDL
ncbi:MAG: hypothetical protein IH840_17090 [Candidatus Heimdallarchaeota archaeon]|nr:hypothetical protein [Candidatus Heimdallarchaeota archaeon]